MADLDTVVKLNYGLFQEDAGQRDPYTNLNWAKEEGHDYFGPLLEKENYICLIAEVEGQPAGYLFGYLKKPYSLRPIHTAELESMFVEEAYRSQKIGEALAKGFLDWAKENGTERVSVSAYAANERAIRFYKSLGFMPKNLVLEVGLD